MGKGGKPWEIGKTFARCAPVGAIAPFTGAGELTHGEEAIDIHNGVPQGLALGIHSSNLGNIECSSRRKAVIAALPR
jgi:acyl-CoA reductase-like NAD-dependent aldehyde dehydrogenase